MHAWDTSRWGAPGGAGACLRLLSAAPPRALRRGGRRHGPAEQVPPQRRAVLLRARMQCCMSERGADALVDMARELQTLYIWSHKVLPRLQLCCA